MVRHNQTYGWDSDDEVFSIDEKTRGLAKSPNAYVIAFLDCKEIKAEVEVEAKEKAVINGNLLTIVGAPSESKGKTATDLFLEFLKGQVEEPLIFPSVVLKEWLAQITNETKVSVDLRK